MRKDKIKIWIAAALFFSSGHAATNGLIPASDLSGNNLSFVNYINTYAQNVAFFLPSAYANELEDALESAAPTRNAISLFAADNNLFSLNHGLSLHLRDHRHFKNRRRPPMPTEMSFLENSQENLIASNELAAGCVESSQLLLKVLDKQNAKLAARETQADTTPTEKEPDTQSLPMATHLPSSKERCRPYTLWFEAIGSFASQNKQDQTIGFDPKTGGFIFAFDRLANETVLAGAGIAYTFTHVSEDQSQGHSDINQEHFFLYSSWEDFGLYVDGALWASIFQTHQVRNIHLPSFDFKSVAHPEGFQLTSHFELGYNKEKPLYTNAKFDFFINPFTMLDWANNWQQSYQEKGNSPFNAQQNAQYSSFLRTEAGFRFYETFFFEKWTLVLEEKGSYVNKTSFNVGRVNAFLVGSAGSFTVETFTSSQNLGVVEMLFGFEPVNRCYPYGSLSYQGEFGSGFQLHQVTTEVSWDF